MYESRKIEATKRARKLRRKMTFEERTLYLESKGLKVIRFWNYEIKQNINLVLDQIINTIGDLA